MEKIALNCYDRFKTSDQKDDRECSDWVPIENFRSGTSLEWFATILI